MNKKVLILNPAHFTKNKTSPNIGDLIISRAVERELHSIFGEDCLIINRPSHSYLSFSDIKLLKNVDYIFVGGSNLLWFRFFPRASFRIGILGMIFYRKLILFGVGWGSYKLQKVGIWSKFISKLIFSKTNFHSVRDEFTANLSREKLGLKNTVNTVCPTLWFWLDRNSKNYRVLKGERCVFSLTDYDKDPENDLKLIDEINMAYKKCNIYFWPQGAGDTAYVKSLGYDGIIIDRSLESLIKFYKEDIPTDYIGTRLHAGVLALEYNLRTLIIKIDNRANEIARDTGLQIIDRVSLNGLNKWIEHSPEINIKLPKENILSWKSQFKIITEKNCS